MLLICVMGFPFTMRAQDAFRYSFCPEAPVVRDHEGNLYRTVQIGSQCWMAENMRCTSSPSGHKWYRNPYFSASQPEYAAYYATPMDPRHGILYNWAAAMDLSAHQSSSGKATAGRVRGICPEGWRLPNNEDWDQLFSTLGGHKIAGEKMKEPSQMWDPYYSILRDNTGFDAVPAGSYTEKGLQDYGLQTYFWCADNFSRTEAWCCILYDYKNDGYSYLDYKCYGHSVRCVKD
ncbi:MAG: fibrobacter succinogenes major paralogous domain-containing protein [Bacteroidales bacterium]|nr:fibrobacter succinogenes major paralogous domain-containing protein [Bacteroidales bacterium]